MLNFCYLGKIKLYESLAPENLNRDGQLALVVHNLLDSAFEAVERAIGNLDWFANGERCNGLFLLICKSVKSAQDTGYLALAQGDRHALDGLHQLDLTVLDTPFLYSLCILGKETCHEGNVLDDVFDLAGEVSLEVYITGEENPLCADAFTVLDLIVLLSRYQDLGNAVLQTIVLYFLFYIFLGFFLFTAGGTDHIPFLGYFAHNYNW